MRRPFDLDETELHLLAIADVPDNCCTTIRPSKERDRLRRAGLIERVEGPLGSRQEYAITPAGRAARAKATMDQAWMAEARRVLSTTIIPPAPEETLQ